MSEAQKENEPTMEEILASIRKIISEDEPEEAAPDQSAEESESGVADEPMELTQMVSEDGSVVDLRAEEEPMAPPEPEPPAAREPEPPEPALEEAGGIEPAEIDDGEIELEENEPFAEDTPVPEPAPVAAVEPLQGLVAESAAATATAAMARLSDSLDTENATRGIGAGDKTLAVLVQETLAPHLKAWLDANLPGLVERIVREEIKKMVKRAEYR